MEDLRIENKKYYAYIYIYIFSVSKQKKRERYALKWNKRKRENPKDPYVSIFSLEPIVE